MADSTALPRIAADVRDIMGRTQAFGRRVRDDTDAILGNLEKGNGRIGKKELLEGYARAAERFGDGFEFFKKVAYILVTYVNQIKSLKDEYEQVSHRMADVSPLGTSSIYDEPIAFTRNCVKGVTDIAKDFHLSQETCLGHVGRVESASDAVPCSAGDSSAEREMNGFEQHIIRACTLRPEDIRVTFDDIVGADAIRRKLENGFLSKARFPNVFVGSNSSPPKGILLYGVPGTGKTMIAKAIAHSLSNVTFFNISASDIKGKFVGESEKRVAALFKAAYAVKSEMGSIIFIDEVDGLLGRRSDGGAGVASSVGRGIVNEFIKLWEGFATDAVGAKPVLVIGATNFPHQLDDGALRRFTERIEVPVPDARGRFLLLKHRIRFERHAIPDEWLQKHVVAKTERFTPADLKELVKKARSNAEMFVTSGDATHVRKVRVVVTEPVREPSDYRVINNLFEDVDDTVEMYETCSPSAQGAEEVEDWDAFPREKLLPPLLNKVDIAKALTETRPSVSGEMERAIAGFTESMGNVL